jgi:hypothetical protein
LDSAKIRITPPIEKYFIFVKQILIAMEKFKTLAISIRGDGEDAYVAEGDDLYYYITDYLDPKFDNIYPCPVGQVAGRFRHDWMMGEDLGELPFTLSERIRKKQLDPKFQEYVKQQKEQFGEKRFELD